MTNGGENGIRGPHRPILGPMVVLAVLTVVINTVNATSRIIEADWRHEALDPRAPFVWEFSSCIALLVLAPLVGLAIERWPPRRANLPLLAPLHAALTIPFSLAHSAGMVALRKAAYALVGARYEFSHGDLPLVLFYEWRKDAITYATVAAIFWFFRWRAELAAARTPASPERIEIRDGASALFVRPAEIAWVEAAGNYVEFHLGARRRMVRGTLAAWEDKLGPLGFVRAHRSRIVNRAHIRGIRPTPSGDMAITLEDGRELAASRRYRAQLESAGGSRARG